jgi:DNA-binding beta-propeller fold protein YncE
MRLTIALVVIVSLLVLSSVAAARGYQINGPSLGYISDSVTSTLRIIHGIPGASTLGSPIDVDAKIRRPFVAVERNYALAILESGDLAMIGNLSEAPSMMGIPGAAAGIDAVAISPNESVAVAYSASASRLQIIAGLPSDAAVHFEIDTTGIGSTLTALAIDNSEQVLAAFFDGENGTVYSLSAGSTPRRIASTGFVSSVAIASAGDRAVVADRDRNQVMLFESVSTTAAPILLASAADGISKPVAVAVTGDGKTAYVANQASGTVTIIAVDGGGLQELQCQCSPTTLNPLRGALLFALTEATDSAVAVFDADPFSPRVFFVPPMSH